MCFGPPIERVGTPFGPPIEIDTTNGSILPKFEGLKAVAHAEPEEIPFPNNATKVLVDFSPNLPKDYFYHYNWMILFRAIHSENEEYSNFFQHITDDPYLDVSDLKAGQYKFDVTITLRDHPEISHTNLNATGGFIVSSGMRLHE